MIPHRRHNGGTATTATATATATAAGGDDLNLRSSMTKSKSYRRRRNSDSNNGNGNGVFDSGGNNNTTHTSTSPAPPDDDDDDNSKTKTSKGFWSYFKKARRSDDYHHHHHHQSRSRNNSISGDTLLPTTYNNNNNNNGSSMQSSPGGATTRMTTSLSSSRRGSAKNMNHSNNINNNTITRRSPICMNIDMNNSFLMGGVDKRRFRRRKQHGLCYRIFWSSLPRRLCVGFALLYMAVFHLIVPFGTWCLFGAGFGFGFGSSSQSHQHLFGGSGKSGSDLLARLYYNHVDSKLSKTLPKSLPSIKQEQIDLGHLEVERSRLEYGGHNSKNSNSKQQQRRSSLLEEIAPMWYHRNDKGFDILLVENDNNENEKKKKKKKGGGGSNNNDVDVNVDVDDVDVHKNADADADADTDGEDGDDASAASGDANENPDADANENENDDGDADNAITHPVVVKKRRVYHKAAVVVGGNNKNNKNNNNRRILQVTGGIAIAEELEDVVGGGGNKDNDNENENNLLLPQRTIHNMKEMAAEYSSCGTTTSTSTAATATTLVVQTSIDRMWILRETCVRWNTDPIIAVVFVPHDEEESSASSDHTMLMDLLDRTERQLTQGSASAAAGRSAAAAGSANDNHDDEIVCPNLTIVRYNADRIESLQGRYPVNRLRNVGLDLVSTSHVLMIDVDFVPSQGLDSLIRKSTSTSTDTALNDNKQHKHTALVVPAFERRAPPRCLTADDPISCFSNLLRKGGGKFLPRTLEELKECYFGGKEGGTNKNDDKNEGKNCVVFQSEFNWDGHSTTRSGEWIHEHWYDDDDDDEDEENDNGNNKNKNSDNDEKAFRKIPCFHTARYEPYVVLEWCPRVAPAAVPGVQQQPIAPYYDERFYGYGKNKIELVSHLRRSGYEFRVLPKGFIIHNPHPESKTKETWNNNGSNGNNGNHNSGGDLHSTMDALYGTFMKELDKMYQDIHEGTVKLCSTTRQ